MDLKKNLNSELEKLKTHVCQRQDLVYFRIL